MSSLTGRLCAVPTDQIGPRKSGLGFSFAVLLVLALATLLTACGGGGGNYVSKTTTGTSTFGSGTTTGGNSGISTVSVSVSPAVATVTVGGSQSFTASVSGSSNAAVTWTITGSGCSGAACGTISTNGVYTAPPNAPNLNTVTVTVTSQADTSKSASATVTVNAPVVQGQPTITISPSSGSVNTRGTLVFSASVANAANATVVWTVTCSGSACGTIAANGVYTAPTAAPSPNTVTVTAALQSNLSVKASALITITTPPLIVVSIIPGNATLTPNASLQFTARLTNATNPSVMWMLSGAGCQSSACGSIGPDGTYIAPAQVPVPNTVSVIAVSVEDVTKSAAATVTLTTSTGISVTVTPTSAPVATGATQQLSATVSGPTIPSVTWTLSGPGCTGAACGSLVSTGPGTATYTAPAAAPTPNSVLATATSVGDPTKAAAVSLTISTQGPVTVGVSPTTASVNTGATQQFIATVGNAANTAVTWALSGAGCTGATCGSITAAGLYTAPATTPSPNLVIITATSQVDNTKSAAATVTVNAPQPIVVGVTPTSGTLAVAGNLQFSATVSNSANQSVTWSVSGLGCTGGACGSITAAGLYTAPASAPSPNTVTVTATSQADNTKSATAAVNITPVTIALAPANATLSVSTVQQFTPTVTGTSNSAVTYSVSGPGCSGSACGTVSAAGVYTAPTAAPSPNTVIVTAQSSADPSKSVTSTITITPVTIAVSPTSATLNVGTQQQFTAAVSGTGNTLVSWTLSGPGCSGASCGAINSNGLYTAPATAPNPKTVIVTVTSLADQTKAATATVTINAPPSAVSVTVTPTAATLSVSTTQQFTATVTGSSNTSVTWTIAGQGCTGATCGSISSSGLYTAPTTAPSPASIMVTATSQADPTQSGQATVSITPVTISISPTAPTLTVNSSQQFTPTVGGTANPAVTYSLSGPGCSGASCGTITAAGLYTAPGTAPSPNTLLVSVTSQVDPTKSAAASVTITPVAVSVSPTSSTVNVNATQQFTATVTGTPISAVTWSVSGTGCSGAACGTVSPAGLYTAPSTAPAPNTVTVTATSQADVTKSAVATVTINTPPPIGVTVSPTSASINISGTQQFTATVTNTGNTAVTWSVSGPGCSGAICGTVSASGLYTAPATAPSPNTVTVSARSQADNTKSAAASVTINTPAPVAVTISPTSATVNISGTQQFTATVTNSTNTTVTWSVSGPGCAGSTCGTVSTSGLYTAPAVAPSPNTVTVTATSQADTTKSAAASVTINTPPPVIVTISPTSATVQISKAQQFTASVSNTGNTAVSWSVLGAGCSGSACGTVDATGLYTAPGAVPSPAGVSVIATSQADNTKSASASVTIAPPPPKTIGTGAFSASATSIDFGSVAAGTTSTQTLTFTNTGTGSATISTAQTCCSFNISGLTLPATIPAGGTLSAIVTFSPSGTGTVSATLSFISDATNSPTNVTVTGSGTVPPPAQIGVSPTSAPFGNVLIGNSGTVTISVTNTGASLLTVSKANLTGDTAFSAPVFAYPFNAQPGQTVLVNLTFTPPSAGSFSASLTFTSNASNNSPVVQLTGTGTTPSTAVTVNPAGTTFGDIAVGDMAAQVVTVTNNDPSLPATLTGTTPFGNLVDVAGLIFPFTLAPGANAPALVTLSPIEPGTASGQVAINTATGSPMYESASGNGITPGTHTVTLGWVASSSVVAGYRIRRSETSGSGYVLMNTALTSSISYVDKTVVAGHTYYYVLTSVGVNGAESSFSNETQAVVPSP